MTVIKCSCLFFCLLYQICFVEGVGNCSSDIVVDFRINVDEKWALSFPGPHHNLSLPVPCQWRITVPDDYAVALTIDVILIYGSNANCSQASLSIYDGYDDTATLQYKYCKNMTQLYTLPYTKDRYQFIKIHKNTDNETNIEVFVTFTAEEDIDSPFGHSSRSVSGIVVGVFAGVILFVALNTAVFLCCLARQDELKRKRRMAYKVAEETPVDSINNNNPDNNNSNNTVSNTPV